MGYDLVYEYDKYIYISVHAICTICITKYMCCITSNIVILCDTLHVIVYSHLCIPSVSIIIILLNYIEYDIPMIVE